MSKGKKKGGKTTVFLSPWKWEGRITPQMNNLPANQA
jgi:hypothetical protein